MVSFSCENCGDILKKPKLDQHAGRCRGAYFTCIDCNTTFEGTSYRAHTSCMSEEQRYHKSVYKPPKGKGAKAQQKQQQQQQQAAAPAAEPAPAAEDESKKRAREEDAPAPAPAAAEEKKAEAVAAPAEGEEPKKKKSKKDKKAKKAAAEGGESATASESATSAPAQAQEESLSAFLTSTVAPLLSSSDALSLGDLSSKVLAAAQEKGRKESKEDVESALWKGLKVGGKKQKVRAEFA
ncbi:hypothetical protein JCM8097_001887 [Rhodosporidiobolus ruineniae]